MPTLQQYRSKLEKVLYDQLGIRYTLPLPTIHEVAVTPDFRDSLIATYGLSLGDLDRVHRVGIGRKLREADSRIYDDMTFERPVVDEERGGILCPLGILNFSEYVLYLRSRDVNILAASYHFQTLSQDSRRPLYVRFEFDPLITDPPKPVFHYHFSNYHLFHKHCHFPAGYFKVPDFYPFAHQDQRRNLMVPTVLDLESFLKLLISAGLVTK
jgi:hypothetical protein